MPRRHLAAVLCVLLLNLQLFAANVLGCVHSGDSHATASHCPHAALPGGGTGAGAAADLATDAPCQKCNLGTVAAGWHLLGAAVPVLAPAARERPTTGDIPQPRTPVPDALLRPPRHFSG